MTFIVLTLAVAITAALARMLREGFGIQGVMGKAGGPIGRRSIAVALFRGGPVQVHSPARPETEQDKVYCCHAKQAGDVNHDFFHQSPSRKVHLHATCGLDAVVRRAKGAGAVLQPVPLSKSAPSRPRLRR